MDSGPSRPWKSLILYFSLGFFLPFPIRFLIFLVEKVHHSQAKYEKNLRDKKMLEKCKKPEENIKSTVFRVWRGARGAKIIGSGTWAKIHGFWLLQPPSRPWKPLISYFSLGFYIFLVFVVYFLFFCILLESGALFHQKIFKNLRWNIKKRKK